MPYLDDTPQIMNLNKYFSPLVCCYHVIVLRDQNVNQHKIFLSSECHADFHQISNYGKKNLILILFSSVFIKHSLQFENKNVLK